MNGYPDLGGREVKEAAGLDDLKALVEHGGRVDGDPPAHVPGGVLERLRDGDVGETGERQGTEWPSRGRQPDTANLGAAAAPHALMNGVVFGIDGQQRHVA